MAFPQQADVEDVLRPHSDALVAIVKSAWSDWLSSSYIVDWRTKRGRANFVWEQIIGHANRHFLTASDVRILPAPETCNFLVRDSVLFRFKKADDVGLSKNIQTQLALAFHDHEQCLFGLPEVARVEIVYILNRLETDIKDICVVAREGSQIMWRFSLMDMAIISAPLPFPTAPPLVDKPASSLVKPRKGALSTEREERKERE